MAKKYMIVSPSDREQVLLMELNHRVKNGLQTVASVLRLQERTVDEVCNLPLRKLRSGSAR
jgi:two-component sensor histidine kinase